MSAIEQIIIDHLHQLTENDQKRVLTFIKQLHTQSDQPPKHYSASELMKLSAAERDQIVERAFALAANEDFEIFEAYSEEPIDDESR